MSVLLWASKSCHQAINILGFKLIFEKIILFLQANPYLPCKYRTISQISIDNWLLICIFWYFWYLHFHVFKIKLQLRWLQQVRWFVTWWAETSIISSDNKLTRNIIRETIKVEKRDDQDRILTYSRVNGTLTLREKYPEKYGVVSAPHFPVFGMNTEIYGVNFRFQSEYRKIRTRNNSAFGYFSRSVIIWLVLLGNS